MSLTLTTARAILRDAALNAGDQNSYTPTSIDNAIQSLCDDFLLRTRQIRKTSTLSLATGTAFLPSLPSGLLPSRVIFATVSLANASATITFSGSLAQGSTITATIGGYGSDYVTGAGDLSSYATGLAAAITANTNINWFVTATASGHVVTVESISPGTIGNGITIAAENAGAGPGVDVSSPALEGGTDSLRPELEIISPGDIAAKRGADRDNGLNDPRFIAFDAVSTGGVVYPTPATDCTINLVWIPALDSFTAGTGSPDSVTMTAGSIAIPDDYIRNALRFGGAGFLQGSNPVYTYGSSAMARYEGWVNTVRGQAPDGSRVAVRMSVSQIRAERGW